MGLLKKGSEIKREILKHRQLRKLRKKAHELRARVINRLGREIVTNAIKNEIKEYSEEFFGSPSFWPWLALYTEIKGEFKSGWLPNDFYRVYLLHKWNPKQYAELSNLKTFYHQQFGGFSIQPLLIKVSGNFYDHQSKILSEAEVMENLKAATPEIIIKKDNGYGGEEVFFKKTNNLKIKDLEQFNGNIVVQPVVQQHEILSKLHYPSLNTLRIVTFLEEDGSISIKYTALKFGVGGNRLDNAYSGGRFVFLDINGNVISEIIDEMALKDGERHPDSGILVTNLKVPSVKKAVQKCIDSHEKFPYVRYFAWDVYIDKSATPKLVEWNAIRPTMWFAEPHLGPIWNLNSIV